MLFVIKMIIGAIINLYESIIKMENDNIEIPKICYCNIEVVNKNREHINTKK